MSDKNYYPVFEISNTMKCLTLETILMKHIRQTYLSDHSWCLIYVSFIAVNILNITDRINGGPALQPIQHLK